MMRREKWWVREIERINRAHAEERGRLIDAIAHLAGKPLPKPPEPAADEPAEEPALPYLLSPESHPDV